MQPLEENTNKQVLTNGNKVGSDIEINIDRLFEETTKDKQRKEQRKQDKKNTSNKRKSKIARKTSQQLQTLEKFFKTYA